MGRDHLLEGWSRLHRATATACCLLIAGIGACEGPQPGQVWIDHPIADSLPLATHVRVRTRPVSAGTSLGELLAHAPDTLWTFGSLAGPPDQILAGVDDLIPIGDEGFVALDGMSSRLLWITQAGHLAASLVASGLGPGEFVDARKLAAGEGNGVWVMDRTARLQRFAAEAGEFVHQQQVKLPFAPRDFCPEDDGFLAPMVSASRDGLVHRVDTLGHVLRSFGEAYRMSSPVLSRLISDADITCREKTVLVEFVRLGEIHAYDADGHVRWVHRLAPFQPMINRSLVGDVRLRSGVARGDIEAGHYLLGSFTVGDTLVVQLAIRSMQSVEERRPYDAIDTYALLLTTGEGAYLGRGSTRWHAVADTIIVGSALEPFPRIVAFRRQSRTRVVRSGS